MKSIFLLICLLITSPLSFAEKSKPDNSKVSLIGVWKLDMTPSNLNDNNFAKMVIRKIDNNQLQGEFYRDGVEINAGRINTQNGRVYAALVSSDNSGSYNSSFYLKDGILYGTTHAIERDFLAVWTATKT